MQATFKAEVRKLFSVRSTYFIWVLSWLLITLFAFWIIGYKGGGGADASIPNAKAMEDVFLNGGTVISVFVAIIGALFAVHEYRYNMIMYTLTSSNSRSKVLLAKFLVIGLFTVGFTILSLLFAVICYRLGLSLRHASLPAQDWDILSTTGRTIFYNLSYGFIGLITGLISRNIAAAVVTFFLVPVTVEPLIGILLHDNATYLPFAALEKVRVTVPEGPMLIHGMISPSRAVGVVCIYLAVATFVTWLLFNRRDAN